MQVGEHTALVSCAAAVKATRSVSSWSQPCHCVIPKLDSVSLILPDSEPGTVASKAKNTLIVYQSGRLTFWYISISRQLI